MTPLIPWSSPNDLTDFKVETGDFSRIEIRAAEPGTFHYFYDAGRGHLIKNFLLESRQRVATLCEVTLIKKGDRYSPRLRLWKRDKSKSATKALDEEVESNVATRLVKASVDTNDCHENFWKLVDFIRSFSDIDLPDSNFRVLSGDAAALAEVLKGQDKSVVIDAVQRVLGGRLSTSDLALLSNRREQLEVFRKLLEDDTYFSTYQTERGLHGAEAVWQQFFENNQWIFGYGLNLIATESVSDKKLEQITTGAGLFTGAGKRSDGVLRTKGYISSLLFAEIKTHRTKLLAASTYRPPDVYRVSDELSGGLAQLQKTCEKAVRTIAAQFHDVYEPDGTPTGIEVSTIRPKMVLVIGRLEEFDAGSGVNREMSMTFELHRSSIRDIDVITFDELYQRACFIVDGS